MMTGTDSDVKSVLSGLLEKNSRDEMSNRERTPQIAKVTFDCNVNFSVLKTIFPSRKRKEKEI